MAFTDTDPLEADMGIRCEDMSIDQLITYIKDYHNAWGRKVAIEGISERAVFKGMRRIYGASTTGLIVKWVFYKYHGVWSDEVVGPLKFSKGRKWWIDMMHQEMQAAIKKDETRSAEPVSAGFASLDAL